MAIDCTWNVKWRQEDVKVVLGLLSPKSSMIIPPRFTRLRNCTFQQAVKPIHIHLIFAICIAGTLSYRAPAVLSITYWKPTVTSVRKKSFAFDPLRIHIKVGEQHTSPNKTVTKTPTVFFLPFNPKFDTTFQISRSFSPSCHIPESVISKIARVPA